MTDLSFKNRIIALISFTFAALILTLRNALFFNFIFFLFTGVVIFFADKIINNEKIKERTALAFFVFATCYQTFFQVFNRIHENNRQLLAASALAVFLAAAFAATDIKKLPYAVFSAPLLCLLDIKIAASYSLFLLFYSVTKLAIETRTGKSGKKKKKSNQQKDKNSVEPITVILVSVVTSVACTAFCAYSFFKNRVLSMENFDYLFTHFKNTIGFVIFIVYFLVKLIKSNLRINVVVIVCLALGIAASVLFAIYYGWAYFSLALIASVFFLGLTCLESEGVTNSIKADCQNNKYIFIAGLLCLIQ